MFAKPFFFFKQKTAYEMRISDWSSDVCSSDLVRREVGIGCHTGRRQDRQIGIGRTVSWVAPKHFPGQRAASPAKNGLVCGGIGRAHHRDVIRARPSATLRTSPLRRPSPAEAQRKMAGNTTGRASCRETVCQSRWIMWEERPIK